MLSGNQIRSGCMLWIAIGALLMLLVFGGAANAAIITVDDSGGADYTRIQDAINNATAGDTIEVYSGTYYENVNVNKQLTMHGIGMPVVDARITGSAITLAADGIVLEGFMAINAESLIYAGIHAKSNNNKLINNNAASNYQHGIKLESSSNNTLTNNTVWDNHENGIYLQYSDNNILINNNANLNYYYGIKLDSSKNNTIYNNTVSYNGGDGIILAFSINNTLSDNIANSNNDCGICVYYSSDYNIMNNNNANLNDWFGIRLVKSSYNTLIGNKVNSNKQRGISLEGISNIISASKNNILIENNVSNNSYGVYLSYSYNNTIYNNYLNNVNNFALDSNINLWNLTKTAGANIIGGSHLGGNFWTNPDGNGFSRTCADSDRDGICDTTYSLDSNNIDYLPLAYDFPSASVTNLTNITYAQTYINWTWTDPTEEDFEKVMIYLNGSFQNNITKGIQYYNATGLTSDTIYNLNTRTVDVIGNINTTWVNHSARTAPAVSRIITVDDSGGADYTRIQDAIDNASAGDTILVYSGAYYENVAVNKRLVLRGEDNGAGIPKIDAGWNGNVVFISSNGVTIDSFIIERSGGNSNAGIYIISSNNSIKNNNISKNSFGIYLSNSNNNTISNNNISTNIERGLRLSYSNRNKIINNHILHNFHGIELIDSSNNTLSDNNASSNTNKGIRLYNSLSNELSGNYVTNNTYSVELEYSSGNTIFNNYFKNHQDNIPITSSTNKWNITKTLGTNIIGGTYFGGNFWSNPSGTGFSQTCTDANNDGICDSPYTLDSYNIDYLPFAFDFPSTSITNLTNITYAQTYINWTWIDSADEDFEKVMIYLNGSFQNNVTKGFQYYNATGLIHDTIYNLSTRTVDVIGNINTTWVNHSARTAPAVSRIITVDDSGGADYTRIQDAIDNASAGDTIFVYNGSYIEQITINKNNLTLLGENKSLAIIHGDWNFAPIVSINSNNTYLSNFTITSTTITGSGILISSSSNITIFNNIISNFGGNGITLISSSDCKIILNEIKNGSYNGIGINIDRSFRCMIENNTISTPSLSSRGILLGGGKWNIIRHNYISNNEYGILLLSDSNYNTIVGNDLFYNNDAGITLMNSKNNSISKNNISFSVSDGLTLYDNSLNNTIDNNSINLNINGILLGDDSKYNKISNNSIIGNHNGIYLGGNADNNFIQLNHIDSNNYGIYIDYAADNIIYKNNFINSKNAYSYNGFNSWDNSSMGNYWSDYIGQDNNSDGIGDTPYLKIETNAGAQDRYPFMRMNGWLLSSDTMRPASITNLTNLSYAQNYINWTWTDPADIDFDRVEIYIDNSLNTNVSKGIFFYNASGFSPDTNHTIATRTVDINGNINQSWINHTARTSISATTINKPNWNGGGSSGGGGGGGGGTSGENYSNIAVKEKYDMHIYKDKVTSYAFTNTNNPIRFVNITGNVNAGEINTAVEVLKNTSTLVKSKAPRTVYKNANIWVGSSGFAVPNNIKEAIVRFRVENSWLLSNNVAGNDVKLFRWNKTEWIKLETAEITKDDTYTYFEGKTNAFSPFAILSLKEAQYRVLPATTTATEQITVSSSETTAEQPSTNLTETNFNWILFVFGALVLIGIISAIYLKKK